MYWLFRRLADGGKSRCDRPEAPVVHLPLQHLQTLRVARFIRIDFGSSVQTLRRLGKLARTAVKIKQLQQRLAVIIFAIRRVIQFAQKLQQLRRSPVRRRDVFHDGDELSPLPAPPLKLFQLARQRYRGIVVPAIQQIPDHRNHLLHSRRVLLKKLPHQRLRLRMPARRHQRVGIGLAQCRRHLLGVQLGFKNKDGRTHLPLCQQRLSVGQRNALIRGILLVGSFVPLRGIATLRRSQLRDPVKCRRSRFAIAQFRRQFGHALQVGLRRLHRHHAIPYLSRFLLLAQLRQVCQRRLVRTNGQLLIRPL